MIFETFFILIFVVIGFLFFLNGFLIFHFFQLKKRLNSFLKKGDQDIGGILANQIKKTEKQEKDLREIFEKISRLEEISKISFQKIAVKRFNPFSEIGGDQSFCIVLLDFQNNGFIITSHYAKDFNRVYAKSVKNGTAEHNLLKQEKEAIIEAINPIA